MKVDRFDLVSGSIIVGKWIGDKCSVVCAFRFEGNVRLNDNSSDTAVFGFVIFIIVAIVYRFALVAARASLGVIGSSLRVVRTSLGVIRSFLSVI